MEQLKKREAEEVTDEELEKITNIYRGLNTTNRYLVTSVTGLLLTSQEANCGDKKAGQRGGSKKAGQEVRNGQKRR